MLPSGVQTATVEWEPNAIDIDGEELLQPPPRASRGEGDDEVDEWLRARLYPLESIVPSADIEAAAKDAGFSERRLKAARERLRVEAVRIDGSTRWGIRLPTEAEE
jgi:hypothetical protein